MISPVEVIGSTPDGADREQTIPQGLTHEDLVGLVGEDYQGILDSSAVLLGLIKEGETLELNYPPPHVGSDAEYVFEGVIGKDWVFVYILRNKSQTNGQLERGRTSGHRHRHDSLGDEFVEEYHVVRGGMSLFLGEGYRERIVLNDEENNHITVPADTFHTAESSDAPAFVLVVMPNSSHIPRQELHSS